MKIKKIGYYLAALMLACIIGGSIHAAESQLAGLPEKEFNAIKQFYFSNDKTEGIKDKEGAIKVPGDYVTLLQLRGLEALYNNSKLDADKELYKKLYAIRYTLRDIAASLKYDGTYEVYAIVKSLIQNGLTGKTPAFYAQIMEEEDIKALIKNLRLLSSKDTGFKQSYLESAVNKIQGTADKKADKLDNMYKAMTLYFIALERFILQSEAEQNINAAAMEKKLVEDLGTINGGLLFYSELKNDKNGFIAQLNKLAQKNPLIEKTFSTWLDVRDKFNELKQEQKNWKNYISNQQKTQDYLAAAAAIIGFAQTFKPTVSGKQSLTSKELAEVADLAAVLYQLYTEYNNYFSTKNDPVKIDLNKLMNQQQSELVDLVTGLSDYEEPSTILGGKKAKSGVFNLLVDKNEYEYQKRVAVVLDAIGNYVLKTKTPEQILADLKQGLGDFVYDAFIKEGQTINNSIVSKLVPPVESTETKVTESTQPAKDTVSPALTSFASALAVLAVVK